MSTQNEQKLKKVLDSHLRGTVVLAKWLEAMGISRELQKRYRQSGWLESVGTGAFRRSGEKVTWQGALYAMQTQAKLPIHAGALTALSMQGLAHYFWVSEETVFLFSPQQTLLPRWFKNYSWGNPVQHAKTSFLPQALGLTVHEERNFTINISTPERAILECLYLSPRKLDLVECYHLMEGLSNLRPKVVQELLEKCNSVKVKRLFLFMASKARHQWLNFIDQNMIDLGKGDRSVVSRGVYYSDFQISIPKELA